MYAFSNPLGVYLGTFMYIEFHNIIQMACKVPTVDLAKPRIFHICSEYGHYSRIIPTNKDPHITTCSTWNMVCSIGQP